MGTRPDPSPFSSDYDLDSLQSINPRGHTFAMWVTPRFLHHYVGRSYERLTARLIANVMAADGLFVDVGVITASSPSWWRAATPAPRSSPSSRSPRTS